MIRYSDLKIVTKHIPLETKVYKMELDEELLASSICRTYNLDKVSSSLLEEYKRLIESNVFYIDKIIQEFNSTDVDGKLKYKLLDNSIVAINEDTQTLLIKLLENKPDIVDYMRKSNNNFMEVLRKI